MAPHSGISIKATGIKVTINNPSLTRHQRIQALEDPGIDEGHHRVGLLLAWKQANDEEVVTVDDEEQ